MFLYYVCYFERFTKLRIIRNLSISNRLNNLNVGNLRIVQQNGLIGVKYYSGRMMGDC